MPVPAKYTKILIDEFDFSGESNQANMSTQAPALESTGFQVDAAEHVAGLPSGTLTHNGYFTGKGAGEIEQELQARLGTAGGVYVAFLFGTNVAACPAYVGHDTWGEQLKIDMPIASLITLAGQWPGQRMRRGLRITEATLSATGAQSSVDLGAAGSDGGKLYVFLQSVDGANASLDLEHSTDDATWATKATVALDSAVGVQVTDLSGTINQYVRINLTDLGLATSIQLVAILAVNGVTM